VLVRARLDSLLTPAFAHGLIRRQAENHIQVEARVPHHQGRHARVFVHVLAVRAHAALRRCMGASAGHTHLAAGRDYADGQVFHVPLPGRRQRLIEVIEVEHQGPLGRGEDPEIEQMAITARLHALAAHRRTRQVEGHDGGGAAKKRQRRLEHAAIANGQEVR
jgi:hypothetical protein